MHGRAVLQKMQQMKLWTGARMKEERFTD
jgi:hypothetical protein